MVAGHGPEQWPLQGTLALPRPALPCMESCCSLASREGSCRSKETFCAGRACQWGLLAGAQID